MSALNIQAIVQARMSSKRLPGKVLHAVHGRPLLSYLLDRLKKSKQLSGVIVATSSDKSDIPILAYCKEAKIKCVAGSLNNVAARFKKVLNEEKMDAFIRISADSPLIDPEIADELISHYRSGGYDIATNVLERTFPKGQSIEIIRTELFIKSFSEMTDPDDQEHVTKFFYRNRNRFRIFNLQSPDSNFSKINLSIDNQEDLKKFESILQRMRHPMEQYGWAEIVKLYQSITPGTAVCRN